MYRKKVCAGEDTYSRPLTYKAGSLLCRLNPPVLPPDSKYCRVDSEKGFDYCPKYTWSLQSVVQQMLYLVSLL